MEVHKEYGRQFLLEPTKLTRIIDIIHERLADHGCTTLRDHFEVFLSGNRREELASIDAVLALANLRKHRIIRLVITCSAGRKGAARPEHEIQLDFAGRTKLSTRDTKVVAISVRSDAVGWPGRTLSELEEQVERTWLPYLPVLALCGFLIVALIVLLFQVLPAPVTQDPAGTMWLRDHDLDRVDQILSQRRPITDEEMRDITARQLRNILDDRRPRQRSPTGRTRQVVCIVIPLLTVIVCGFILLLTCYPGAVFLWGDEEQRYASLLQRRKTLWGIIIGVPVVGLLANLLIIGVASWLPPG